MTTAPQATHHRLARAPVTERYRVRADWSSFGALPDPSASIDVWNTDDLIETMYGNPDVAAGFVTLFAEPPTPGVYRTSAWGQW